MSKRPGVTVMTDFQFVKTVILFIHLNDCVSVCHSAFRISSLNLHCFDCILELMLQGEGGGKAKSTDGQKHLQAGAFLPLQCLYLWLTVI